MVNGVLFSHLTLIPGAPTCLWSENPYWEVVGHVWFLLGPPLGVFLGLRNLVLRGDSLLPFVSVPLGAAITIITYTAIAVAFSAS